MSFFRINNPSLKYKRFLPYIHQYIHQYQDVRIRKFKFLAKTQFLSFLFKIANFQVEIIRNNH